MSDLIQKRGKLSLVSNKEQYVYPAIFIGAGILYLVSLYLLQLNVHSGLEGIRKTLDFGLRLLMMDFSEWQLVLKAAIESISVAILATIISAVLAFVVSFFAASNVSIRFLTYSIKGLVAVIRAVPTIIWTLVFVAYLGFGPFPGVLGLFFHSFAYLVKAFSESIEEVKPGVIEAMKSTGASWSQIMLRGIFPSIQTSLISWTALRFEINIGQSAILGLVGAGGIGMELSKNMRFYDFNKSGFVLLVIFLMSFSIEMIFHKLKLGVDQKKLVK